MPRRPRIQLAETPLHIVQRGINREPCFFAEEDYHCYLHWLEKSARDWGCAIHAYVLMTNHVRLLVTPAEPAAPARLMQPVGRRYVQLGMPVGNDRFAEAICAKAGIRRNSGKRGRPAGRLQIAPCGYADKRISGFEALEMMNS